MRRIAALAALPAVAAAVLVPLSAGSAAHASDDYPYASDSTNSADPWGFTKRQCVSFVAFRLAEEGAPLDNGTQNWGSALTWDDAARRLHKPVSATARVGAVAQWNAEETSAYYANGSRTPNGYVKAGDYGHVAVVTKVFPDGSVNVEQYNMGVSRAYTSMHLKAPRYLYLARAAATAPAPAPVAAPAPPPVRQDVTSAARAGTRRVGGPASRWWNR